MQSKSERNSSKQGEVAEWSIAAVLKTVEGNTSGGSNPSLSARKPDFNQAFFVYVSNLAPEAEREIGYFVWVYTHFFSFLQTTNGLEA